MTNNAKKYTKPASLRGALFFVIASIFSLISGCAALHTSNSNIGNAFPGVAKHDPYRHENIRYIFDDNALPTVTITLTEEALNRQLELYDQNPRHETQVSAGFAFEKNGVLDQVKGVGFRIKGNTSRARISGNFGEKFNPDNPQWHQTSMLIDFNEYDNDKRYRGLKKLTFRYFSSDPTFLRIAYAENLMRRFGVWTTPIGSYARLYINIEGVDKPAYFGIYQITEAVDKDYLVNRFGNDDTGYLWKCTLCLLGAPVDLNSIGVEYIDATDDDLSVRPAFDLKRRKTELEKGREVLLNFIEQLNTLKGAEFENWIEESFDVDLFLRAIAARIVMADWDNYWTNNNNYYFYYNKKTGKFYFIPHDFDNVLSKGGLIENPTLRNPLIFGDMNMGKPLIYKLLNSHKYRDRFKKYLALLVDESKPYFHPKSSHKMVDDILKLIDPYEDDRFIKNDTNSAQYIHDPRMGPEIKAHYTILPKEQGTQHNSLDFFAARTTVVKEALRVDEGWQPRTVEDLTKEAEHPLTIFGTVNDWDYLHARGTPEKYQFRVNKALSRQELRIELEAGIHKFQLLGRESAEGTFQAYHADKRINIEVGPGKNGSLIHKGSNSIGAYPASSSDRLNSLTLAAPVKGHYELIFDYSDPDSIRLHAKLIHTDMTLSEFQNAEDARTRIFLRGDFNEWSTNTPFRVQQQKNHRVARLYIKTGKYLFKMADADWKEINIGSPSGIETWIVPGDKHILTTGENAANLFIYIEKEGFYEFHLYNSDKKNPTLIVYMK